MFLRKYSNFSSLHHLVKFNDVSSSLWTKTRIIFNINCTISCFNHISKRGFGSQHHSHSLKKKKHIYPQKMIRKPLKRLMESAKGKHIPAFPLHHISWKCVVNLGKTWNPLTQSSPHTFYSSFLPSTVV